jgi:HSP20 family protein
MVKMIDQDWRCYYGTGTVRQEEQKWFGKAPHRNRPFAGYKAWPAIDVAEEDEAILIRAEVPGCKADDIDISVHGNVLTISGEKKFEEEKKEKGYYHMESSYGSFRRELNLPAEVDAGKIDAVCKDGVLSLTLPKAATAKAVKVKVKG